MTKQQEFRKQTEEAKLEAFSLMCKKVAELEKENAELKKKCYKKAVKDYCEVEKQLTKAKGHIKQLLDCLKQDTNDPQTNYYVCQYMDKAEQFLKEIEK